MEKKIEDYLHLYLGCECIMETNNKVALTGFRGKKPVITLLFKNGNKSFKSQDTVVVNDVHLLKPILRQLSSMTEEEFKLLCNDVLEYYPDEIHKQKDAIWGRRSITKERCRLSFDINDFHTLHFWTDFTHEDKKLMPPLVKINSFVNKCRQMSFDMDELIHGGLAIKSKTNK